MPNDTLDTTKENVSARISAAADNLSANEKAILAILVKNWGAGMRISQREIADDESWLLRHPDYRSDLQNKYYETATRVAREEIRALRIQHKIPVLADGSGYFLPTSAEEVTIYLKRMESEAKARAAASLETYRAMQEALGVKSDFFEVLGEAAVDESDAEPETQPEPEVQPLAQPAVRKVKPEDYIWEAVSGYFKANFPDISQDIKWEKCPSSTIRWQVVFGKPNTPSKNIRSQIRSTFYASGFGYPEFTKSNDDRWVMSLLCSAQSAKSAFCWRKRTSNFERMQKSLWQKVQAVASRMMVSLESAQWRPSLTKPDTHYVLEFPKSVPPPNRLKDGLLLEKVPILVEHGTAHKLIFKIV